MQLIFQRKKKKEFFADYESRASAMISTVDSYFGIGSRWQIGGFLIGCDWVGYEATIVKSPKSFKDKEAELDEILNDEVDEVEKPRLLVANFHLGYSF